MDVIVTSHSTSLTYIYEVVSGSWLFIAAYTCSGLAGLIYEVAWVRTLALYMGHTTAATSTVVAAFMGGMAAGSAIGGRVAARCSVYYALVGYAVLESVVILMEGEGQVVASKELDKFRVHLRLKVV